MPRTRSMQQAMRVLKHASRLAARAASDSTLTTTAGRLAEELEDYVKRLKRLEEQGKTQEFYAVLQNAQMKLVKLVCKLLR